MVGRIEKTHNILRRLVQNAKNVVMLQDRLSINNVQFYMELENVDCADRAKVSAAMFDRPIEIHPLCYTTEQFEAIANIKKCYQNSFELGVCVHPFMVMCSSAALAEYIVHMLRKTADEMGTDKKCARYMVEDQRKRRILQELLQRSER